MRELVITMTCTLLLALSMAGQPGPALEFPPLKPYQHTCPIGTSYDRFTDESVSYVNLGRLAQRDTLGLVLIVKQEFKGKERKAAMPSTMITFFFRASPRREPTTLDGRSLLQDWSVFFVFEKGRIERPQAKSSFLSYYDNRIPLVFSETIAVSVNLQEFLDLVNSDWVDCRVGGREFRLTDQQRAGLRDFAARMAFDDAVVRAKLGLLGDDVGNGMPPTPKNAARAVAPPAERPETKKDAAQAETKLRMAGEMERRQNVTAAIGYYREILKKFPQSAQAKVARLRLKALDPPGKKS
ncbi:MAG: tetratricopeptide repeat protein [Isosphaeraceae bacterium]